MDLIDRLKALGEKAPRIKEQVETEEATKNAFVMPFISALGYDVFNPLEVKPEFVADIGIKKGEKVDYCIFKDGQPIIIIECKHWKEELDPHNSQLFRYFHVAGAKFAILTNGINFRFYTDLVNPNKMDEKPFLEFSIERISESVVNELKKFHKAQFDQQEIFNTASELKYSKEIKDILSAELKNPTEEFVKYFASRVYSGRITNKVLEQFVDLVNKSVKALISEMVSNRLQSALEKEEEVQGEAAELSAAGEEAPVEDVNDIETTDEELEAFHIVRAILRKEVTVARITLRDIKTYCGILLDDNNRKPICRLRFNSTQKYLGLFDTGKDEEKIPIESVDDIYQYADRLAGTVRHYLE